jgi:putative transposase
LNRDDRKTMIDNKNEHLSIKKQCELVNVSQSSYYYKLKPESEYNITLMHMIDEEFTRHPFMGTRTITAYLNDKGMICGRKLVRRLMRVMGLEPIYPKPKTSIPNKQHAVYPYLLRDVEIVRSNQVWSTDITYIRLKHGFAYLVAIMDWYSRKVLSWRLSNTMDVAFCLDALDEAIEKYGCPEIFNSDQGSQFTSLDFIGRLKSHHISISMDGKGRAIDNIFIERLWRTVKYQNVYIKGYETMTEARDGLNEFFNYYNNDRLHQSLGYRRPIEVYLNGMDRMAA